MGLLITIKFERRKKKILIFCVIPVNLHTAFPLFLVTAENISQNNLSAVCQLTVGCALANRWPTVS